MKILSYLNVSNLSNLEADSGYVFQRSILQKLIEFGHEVILIGPPNMPNIPSEISIVETPFPESKYGVRFGFNWELLKEKITPLINGLDILLINQSELTIPFSILIYEVLGKKIPSVTYFHYLAVWGYNGHVQFDPSLDHIGIGKAIWQRQIESAQFSNANIIGSNFGKNMFITCANDETLGDKFHIISPPVKKYQTNGHIENSKPTLFYNHRLYSHYGGKKLFELLKKINKRHSLSVIVTDPTTKRSATREKLDPSVNEIREYLSQLDFVQINHYPTQEEYYDALLKVDIGFAPLRKGALWSMSAADLMSAGVPVVAPQKEVFFEVVKDKDLLFSNDDEFESLLTKLITDKSFRTLKGNIAREHTLALSIENIARKFEDLFLTLKLK